MICNNKYSRRNDWRNKKRWKKKKEKDLRMRRFDENKKRSNVESNKKRKQRSKRTNNSWCKTNRFKKMLLRSSKSPIDEINHLWVTLSLSKMLHLIPINRLLHRLISQRLKLWIKSKEFWRKKWMVILKNWNVLLRCSSMIFEMRCKMSNDKLMN